MSKKKNLLLEGPLFPAMLRFSIPILLSLMLQSLYATVDLWMVSRFGTKADVSAVSTGSQTVYIATGVISGLAMGITILLGQSVGEHNDRRGANIIGTSTWIFAALSVLLAVIFTAGAPAMTAALHAPDVAVRQTTDYIRICGLGTLFVVGFNVLNGIFCGLGDSKTPLLFVGIACVVNIIGDYVLIALLQLGAQGAAVATITAQAVSVLFSFLIIRKRLPFPLQKENMAFQPRLAGAILRVGLPVALLRMCNELSYLLVLGFVNTLGVTASSGVGIAEKLVLFILLIPTAYMSAVSAFVAQNTGAGQDGRARKSMWIGMATASVFGGVMAYFSFFHGDTMSLLFIREPAVVEASAEFLKATSLECFVLSAAYCFDGYFDGIKKTGFVMLEGIAAAVLVRIPCAYLASIQPEPSLFHIGFAGVWSAVFMLLLCSVYYIVRRHRERHLLFQK